MKKTALITFTLAAALVVFQVACTSQAETKEETPAVKQLSQSELLSRGKYLVSVSGCNDCHSPKVMGPHGPMVDSANLLSGHPANMPLPKMDAQFLQPGNWMGFGPAITCAVGPWGVSFAANLTPDSATGIGAWSEETFIKTLRTGKHLGQENGRPILPPMPWEGVAQMTDEDLKAVYTYLQALPAISNRVPTPLSPDEVKAMIK